MHLSGSGPPLMTPNRLCPGVLKGHVAGIPLPALGSASQGMEARLAWAGLSSLKLFSQRSVTAKGR